jgi:two-component system sensor histidine kinase AlgZ
MVSKNTQLPNLQNLGILLRILVGVNVLTMLAAVLISAQLHAFVSILTELSTVVQPVLLLSIFVLYLLYPLLKNAVIGKVLLLFWV